MARPDNNFVTKEAGPPKGGRLDHQPEGNEFVAKALARSRNGTGGRYHQPGKNEFLTKANGAKRERKEVGSKPGVMAITNNVNKLNDMKTRMFVHL
jgi:hypothetical protein